MDQQRDADERRVGLQTRFTFRRYRQSVLAYGPERKTIERNIQLKQSFTTSCVSRKLNAVGSIAASVTSQQTRIKHIPVSGRSTKTSLHWRIVSCVNDSFILDNLGEINHILPVSQLTSYSLSAKNYSILMHNYLDRLSYQQTGLKHNFAVE